MIFITLNEMSAQLFQRITSSNHAIKISSLAEALSISPRQVRYNLDKIDEFLTYHKFPLFIRKQNVGVSYVASQEIVAQIMEKLQNQEVQHYIASQEERMDIILAVLLQQQDYITIDDLAKKLNSSRSTVVKDYLTEAAFQPKNAFTETLKLIEEHCEIKNYDGLVSGLAKILKTENLTEQKGVVQPLLRELLTANMIKIKVNAKNWEEVIYAGGKILEDHELVEHRYVEAMINTVKKMGAYIVIANGIAMPHARPEDGAKKVGMALLTLKTPVNFGSKENDPVTVVIFLCA